MNVRLLIVGLAFLALAAATAAQDQGDDGAGAKPAARAVAQWRMTLLDWRKEFFAVGGEDRQAQWQAGRERIAAIDDPAAIPAIIALLKTEKHPQFRRALIQPLITLGGKEAMDCLVKLSVEDDNPLLREEAAKGVASRQGLEAYLDTYITYLKSPKYVSNAAEALGWTKLVKPMSTADKPNENLAKGLVNALHTVQVKTIPYRVTFDSGTRAHMTRTNNVGPWRQWGTDEGMVRVRIPVPQPKVLAVLQEYSGQAYEYDESQWRAWLRAKGVAE
jgi:hypothetical protein